MLLGLTLANGLTLHGLVTALAVLIYVIAAHVLHQRRNPTSAIAWVLFIMLIPYLALPAFLAFGFRKLARPRTNQRLPAPAADAPWAIQTIHALGQPAPAAYHALHLHADGSEALRALRETMDGATRSVDLSIFILGRDTIGSEVIDRLCAKARAGLRVRLLLDGLGSLMAGRPKLERLVEAGASVTLFVPPLHSPLKGRTNLRDHRKMLIADAGLPTQRLWCGGRNLAAEYFEGSPGQAPWHDLSFDVQGALVLQASELFAHDWAFAKQRKRRPEPLPSLAEPPEGGGAQLVASGPDQVDDTVYALLITAAYRARRRIALVTPYFVPDTALLLALGLAARRGVAVDLLIPARSNHRLSDVARGRALRALAQAGGRIWLAPQMLHAKLAVVDDVLALAGSANLDSRSLFLNYELMVAFHDREAIVRFASWFEHELASCERLVPRRVGLFADVAEGLVLWTGFQL
jgi:cardiolipin synthase